MVNLMCASNQWASRPNDERFWSLEDLSNEMTRQKRSSAEFETDLRNLTPVVRGKEICLVTNKDVPMRLSHWAFNQLSGRLGAPANFLRSLPPDLAAENLQYCFKSNLTARDDNKVQLMAHKNGDYLVRAITSPGYGRIWNADLVSRLNPAIQNGWMVPPARPVRDDTRARKATKADIVPGQESFGLSVKEGDMIAPAGVYAGDRDMFVFLVNPKRIINDGNKGLMRGVFIWNSEVGVGAFKVKTFYLENVCGNHICWGASNVREIKIVHRKKNVLNFDRQTLQVLHHYANQSSTVEESAIAAGRKMILGKNKEEVVEFLFRKKPVGISKGDLESGYDFATKWEHTSLAPPTSVWGMVHGLTRFSQTSKFADERNALDVGAGKILTLAV